MAHSLAHVYLHLVFSTKNQYPFLLDDSLRRDTFAYLGGICRQLRTPALKVGGAHDHVHILCRFSRTITIANLLYEIKRGSSKWVKTRDRSLRDFYRQNGYGAFSVGLSGLDAVSRYIERQEIRHKTESFKEEFRRILDDHDIEYDERYIWD